jgi:PAS domain S-box-containing protein
VEDAPAPPGATGRLWSMNSAVGVAQQTDQVRSDALAQLAAIVESSDDAIVSKDLDGIIQSWNQGAQRIFGWSAEEAIGKPITIIIPPDRLDEEPKIIARIRAGERVDHFETIRITKDGRKVHVSVTISPVRDREGRIVGASKIARDTTLLREYERRLTDFIENATIGLHWVAADGTILWANRCELEMLGYTREEYVGRNIVEIHVDRPVIDDIMARLARGETLIDCPSRLRHKDGSIRHVLINSCVRFEDGAFENTQCFTRDVTALKNAEEERNKLLEREHAARVQAEHASRMKDEFLATLSHELRTPLNAILGYAHLLREGSIRPDEMQAALDVIERNARSQTQIIEDLLDMSRIVSGKIRLDVQRVDLAAAVTTAIDTLRPAAEAKGVRLTTVLDPLVGPVRGDPARLQQVVWNLLSNAIKFTPKAGKVQVALERVNSHVEIVVSDTGEGINPDFLPFVFDRFRQADPSSTRRHGGLGIGLAIVKQLTELHGGSVRAKSPGPGQGSTFVVALPLSAALEDDDTAAGSRVHPKAEAAPSDLSDHIDLSGVRVLVVDDQSDARELIAHILTGCHAQVYTAESMSEALRAMRAQPPDVLISDIGMPGHDGYELIQAVRALPREAGGDVPAAAVTAFARSEDRRRAMLAGFQTHIAKPVEPAELITVIASLAGKIGRAP